MLLDKST